MGTLALVLQLLQFAPSIFQLILQAEQLFGAGNGVAKKAAVLAPLTIAGAAAPVVAQAGQLVDNVVGGLNAAGVFKKA